MAKLPRGIRNNNPLNIRKGNNWQGERHPQIDNAFEEFTSMTWGLRAGFLILKRYLTPAPYGAGCTCIQDIIERWAPPSENLTLSYIKQVCKMSKLTAREPIHFSDKEKLVTIVHAMCFVECGTFVPKDLIYTAYDIARG